MAKILRRTQAWPEYKTGDTYPTLWGWPIPIWPEV